MKKEYTGAQVEMVGETGGGAASPPRVLLIVLPLCRVAFFSARESPKRLARDSPPTIIINSYLYYFISMVQVSINFSGFLFY